MLVGFTCGFYKRWFVVCFLFALLMLYWSSISTEKGVLPHSLFFHWLDLKNSSSLKRCRNSAQGPYLIADEKGQVCKISQVQSTGCCNHTFNNPCYTCSPEKCCTVFEFCVSCCLQPEEKDVLKKVLLRERLRNKKGVVSLAKDTFELCLLKCRTSSSSIINGNKYHDQAYKYCFSLDGHIST